MANACPIRPVQAVQAVESNCQESPEILYIGNVNAPSQEPTRVVCAIETSNRFSALAEEGQWVRLGSGEVTVDSAADESCWPAEEGGAYEVRAMDQCSGKMLGMTFQVTEVRKPLAAVWRLAERSNLVQGRPMFRA